MKRTSIKSLVISKTINSISSLRTNTSGYFYVTMLSGTKSSNLYLSKTATATANALGLMADDKIPAELLKNSEVVETTNEAKEVRYKLSFGNSGVYASSTELNDIFGIEEQMGDFDVVAFKATFTEKPVAA